MSDDERDNIMCKYGDKCYQTNPAHLSKYKHPKKRNRSPDEKVTKKPKLSPNLSKNDSMDDDEFLNLVEKCEEANDDIEHKKDLIKQYFLVEMPKDFYDFWQFCKELSDSDPKNALKDINLQLVGPYDILAGNEVKNEDDQHLLHWRYYYDPPEFQTIIKGDDKTQHHLGYFRDSPDQTPCFVAENYAKRDCIIKPLGENIFGAVINYLSSLISRADPFKRMTLTKIQEKIKEKAKLLNLDVNKSTNAMQKREKSVVAKTFHSAGVVVDYNKKTEIGYRPLQCTYKELTKLCDRISKANNESRSKAMSALQPILTAATIALDECDFGTGLELGINLFCYGHENLDNTALRMLSASYSVLDREAFIEIAKAHLKNRRRNFPHVVTYG